MSAEDILMLVGLVAMCGAGAIIAGFFIAAGAGDDDENR